MLQFCQFNTVNGITMMDKEHYLISQLSSEYIGDDAAVVGDTLYSMDAFLKMYILKDHGCRWRR
jgi:hypothetical protein